MTVADAKYATESTAIPMDSRKKAWAAVTVGGGPRPGRPSTTPDGVLRFWRFPPPAPPPSRKASGKSGPTPCAQN
ncbi:hypothetical protein EI555_017406 [Monodon monoceros]|uniref:Uncharacterized protein n=1 Tax=Monodon monoceros TaxID=40151 RepID=A0A4U1ECE2_MONMO|nr:hypothetical protein EI555_017406 [Monodon monoceros]